MAVLLPDRELTVYVLDHPWGRDAHGVPVPPPPDARPAPRGTWPGAATEQADESWTLRVDPAAWRVREGDVIGDGIRTWTVVSALLRKVPGHSAADYIAVTATLNPPEVP
ncbi:hypothetical protein SAM9427_36695 (plasmid) [Streptomyces sp. ETH9427]|uniref:hypothetical protein n=1 Tax=Streptomyces sp. E1N211 TaxID=1851876 RepID=UPI000E0A677B|nr:hypothetical protein [Streptomyces sp. E1N211]AXI91313.1 hypothetical protein SAM9427_36695 [Streptomyces sp. ETH9427]